jgi:tetratricopeptide (TPR) repeat protein
MGRFEQSEAVLTEARALLERAGPPKLLSFYFFNFAYMKALAGDLLSARRHYEQSLALDRDIGDEFGPLAAFGNLANVNWALGDLDAAENAFRQQVALVRESPMRTRRLLGWALASLAGVLTERGQLDEALAAAREGLPLLGEDGSAWIFVDHVALRAALAGKLSDAARLAGYSECTWPAKEATRHPVEARACDRLHALLGDKFAPDELARLRAEGMKLSEVEACRLALED